MQTVCPIPGTQAAVVLIYTKGVTLSFKAGIIIFLLYSCRLDRKKRFNDKAHSKQVSVRYCINRATSVPYNYVSFLYQPKLIPVNSFSKFSWHFYEFYILSAHQCVYIPFPHLYWFWMPKNPWVRTFSEGWQIKNWAGIALYFQLRFLEQTCTKTYLRNSCVR